MKDFKLERKKERKKESKEVKKEDRHVDINEGRKKTNEMKDMNS